MVDILKYEYKLNCTYDACQYPGIQCKYNCSSDDKNCHKVSFMIFRTGSVLIVGKCNDSSIIYQIYEFIKKILTEHYESIYAINNETHDTSIVKKKKIKKKQIICHV